VAQRVDLEAVLPEPDDGFPWLPIEISIGFFVDTHEVLPRLDTNLLSQRR
jgi:hypothetical protein